MQLSLDSVAVPAVEIRVAGEPQPKGSKVGRIIGKRITPKRGPYAGQVLVLNPSVSLVEQSDMQTKTQPSDRLAKWSQSVNGRAFLAWRDAHGGVSPEPWDCACELSCEFILPRPDGHWLSPGRLRKGAPAHPEVKPDLSKLVRAVEDALIGVVYRDDSRVVRYGEMGKRYAAWGGSGGAVIRVRPI